MSMQAKIIDYASDAITKQLQKIDKDDVKKIMANVTGAKNQSIILETSLTKVGDGIKEINHPNVTSSDEYCAMLQNEFNFNFSENAKGQKGVTSKKFDLNQQPSVSEEREGLLKKNVSEDRCEKIEIPTDDESKFTTKSEMVATDAQSIASSPDPSRQYSQEVQSFVQKKNIAQGMMDLALVSANCNQLRYVLDMNDLHPYYMTSLILIGTSLALQVIVGLGLLYSNSYNLRRNQEVKAANKFSSLSIVGVFLITIINVLISTFNGTNLGASASPTTTTVASDGEVLVTTAEAIAPTAIETEVF